MQSDSDSIERVCALSLMLGCCLGIVAHIIHPDEPQTSDQVRSYLQHSPHAHVVLMFGVLFFLLGFPGLCARLNRPGNFAGLASLPLLFVGVALGDMIHCPIEFGALPAVSQVTPDRLLEIYGKLNGTPYGVLSMIAPPLMILGVLLFLIGTWKSKAMPNWPRWILVGCFVSMLGTLAGSQHMAEAFPILLYAAFLAYGALMLLPAGDRKAIMRPMGGRIS